MDITITIPDALATDAIRYFAYAHGYQDIIPDPADPNSLIPNPETKAQFGRKMLRNFIKEAYVEGKAKEAAQTERTNSGGQFG